MKKTILLFATLLSTVYANAQQMNLSWAKAFVAPNSLGSAQVNNSNITTVSNGDVIVTGLFKDTIDFDPAAATSFLLQGDVGNFNAHITRLNSSGDFIWSKMLNGDDDVQIINVQLDANGNHYLLGIFEGTCDFNPDPQLTNSLTSYGNKDVFLCKLNSAGNFLWAKQFGNSDDNSTNELITDNAGVCYFDVTYRDSIDADPGVGQNYFTANGLQDALFLKLNDAGNLLNAFSLGGAYVDVISDIHLLPGNELLVTGSILGTVDLNPGVGTYSVSLIQGTVAGFILKLNAQLAFTWAKVFPGQNAGSLSRIESIDLDQAGNIYVGGIFQGDVDFNPDSNGVAVKSSFSGTVDSYLMKLSSTGQFNWVHSFGANFPDYASSVAVFDDGRCFLFGEYSGQIDLDPDTVNTVLITSPGSFGNYQNYIVGLDANGVYNWGRGVSGYGAGFIGNTLITDGNNQLYSCGYFGGTADFDPNSGVFNLSCLPSTGGSFLIKLSPVVTGVEESLAADFLLYPNPAFGQVLVQSASGSRIENVQVFDLSGKCVTAVSAVQSMEFRMDVSSLAAGMYLLQVTTNEGVRSKKLQVVK